MNLQVFLQMVNEYCHVVRAANPADLRRKVHTQYPDVALIDWELPRVEMDRLLADLRTACPHLIVIALNSHYPMPDASRPLTHRAECTPV